jgi:hypothetical protein
MAELGEGKTRPHSSLSLHQGEDGVKVIPWRHSIGLRQEEANILVGKDHGHLCLDGHSVSIAACIGAQGEIGSDIGRQSRPDVVEG